MKRNLAAGMSRTVFAPCLALLCFLLFAGPATSAQQAQATVPALLVSDIHFDPFWDPDKVPQLAATQVSQWKAILAAPSSPDQRQRFQSLQQSCHARGADTSFTLLESSLKAMRSHAAGVRFVTLSGDLLAHSFPCKYNALLPESTPDGYKKFVAKTLDYVVGELNGIFPGVPVYVALGNNDSDCGDYRLDAHSEFLRITGQEITKDFPASERETAQKNFAAGGYYSVSLPAPIKNARLLVLDDLFMAHNYATCGGKADSTAADAQLAWLAQQLAEARRDKQKVWVMGHIPPGIDLYATVTRVDDVCGGQKPKMFLASEKLADTLVEYGDVVELAIFAHTHMDELRLLQPRNGGQNVAVKMVSSISPINGNNPSFTIAQVDPSSAALVNYKVFAASNQTGVHAVWREEYDYARSYHETVFSSSSVTALVNGFKADPDAKTQASRNYIEDFSVGRLAPVLKMFWPQYVCTLSNDTAETFRACFCSATR